MYNQADSKQFRTRPVVKQRFFIIIQCSQKHSDQFFCLCSLFMFLFLLEKTVLFKFCWSCFLGLSLFWVFCFILKDVGTEQMFYYSDCKIKEQVEFIPEMDSIPSYQLDITYDINVLVKVTSWWMVKLINYSGKGKLDVLSCMKNREKSPTTLHTKDLLSTQRWM